MKWSFEYDACISCGTTEERYIGEGLCASCFKKEYDKERYRLDVERREYLKKKGRDRYKKYKKFIEDNLGSSCFFCGYDNPDNKKTGLVKHEIRGTPHSTVQRYYKDHIEDFVLLCASCHRGVHWSMNTLKLSWEEIKTIFNNKIK